MRVSDRRPFALAMAALIALAWLSLVAWGRSPYDRFLGHEALGDIDLSLGGGYAAIAVVFVAGWTLMTVAMMLPTSLPLVYMFYTMVRRRPEGRQLVALLVAGYLAIWTFFGVLAHLGDLGLHGVVEQAAWLEGNAWVIGAATLLLAGVYQFTPLKYHCLDKCRSPFAFINEHWSGGREAARAFRLGVDHGIFCVGCCWSLMLLMFAVGVGNIGWMLVLGTVMAVEKNMPWGRRLSAPLGVALLAWGLALGLARWPLSGLA